MGTMVTTWLEIKAMLICNFTARLHLQLFMYKLSASFPAELNRSFEMSSFVETGATAILEESPVEFVKYP